MNFNDKIRSIEILKTIIEETEDPDKKNHQKAVKDIFSLRNNSYSFYSLKALFFYEQFNVFHSSSLLKDVFFEALLECFSPNLIPFLPSKFFDEWTLYIKKTDPNTSERIIDQNISQKENENFSYGFINSEISFINPSISIGDPIFIKFKFFSYLPKTLESISLFIQFVDSKNLSFWYIYSLSFNLLPNKLYNNLYEIQYPNNITSLKIDSINIIYEKIKFRFQINSSNLRIINISSNDKGSSFKIESLPFGLVGHSYPITFTYKSANNPGYQFGFNWKNTELNIILSSESNQIRPIPTTIDVIESNKEYKQTLFLKIPIPVKFNWVLNWHIFRNNLKSPDNIENVCLDVLSPFSLKFTLFDENRNIISLNDLNTNTEYIFLIKLNYLLNYPLIIENINLNNLSNDLPFKISSIICKFPIILNPNEKSSCFFKIFTNKSIEKISLGNLEIFYKIDCIYYKDLIKYNHLLPDIKIKHRLLNTKLNFPFDGVKFQSNSFSLEFTNLDKFPLDAVLIIKESKDFFIEGKLNYFVSLFPNETIIYKWNFFPLSQGTLKFPLIILKSSVIDKNSYQKEPKILWQGEPILFVNFSESL